jgi:hypothetical protein
LTIKDAIDNLIGCSKGIDVCFWPLGFRKPNIDSIEGTQYGSSVGFFMALNIERILGSSTRLMDRLVIL